MAFRRDAMSIQPYMRTTICHIRSRNHNLNTFDARKLKFGVLLTQT